MESLLGHTFSLLTDGSAAAASALVSAMWQGAVLAACTALALRLVPRLSAAARSLIWMNVFALLVLLPFLPAFSGHEENGFPANGAPVRLDVRWSLAIVGLWAFLSIWKGTELVFSAIRLRGIARRAVPVDASAALQELLLNNRAGGKPGRAAMLCTSAEVERPCVLGFFRPRVLLPPGLLEQLSPLELQLVVEHEMEHLRRGDDWSNLLQKLGLVLFPLNPVLLWVERRLCTERELACDDRVLRSSAGPKAYAICLTRLAEHSMLYRGLSLVLGAWERQSELVRRVHRILRRPSHSMGGKTAALAMGGLLAGALGCAVVLARSPQLVSFSSAFNSSFEARSLPAADLRPASSSELGSRPQLVKAVLPSRPVSAQVPPKRPHSTAARRVMRSQTAPSRQQMLVLTDWRETEAVSFTEFRSTEPAPRLIIAVDRKTRASYAAVQFADGWFIVQI
jgi:beta-lactamase regulating signal transducer with metallopeptidase domain